MSFLALEHLEKTYPDGTRAVKGIDLSIDEGQFIVLLGPSGCGKTTTLRMIAGLEIPTTGRISLAGRDVTGLRPSQRNVGFVFQFYALYPHLSVAENIAFPLECAGVARAERSDAVARMAKKLGLLDLLARKPRELSGGDQQRVSLARAMVRAPDVYLMDEPLGTLDAPARLEMGEYLRSQQLAQRTTTVYVTHDQDEAMRLADRIVVMSEGRILQDGAPDEVYDRPANLFVARFVGSPGMNLIEGDVVEERGERRFRTRDAGTLVALSSRARAGAAVLGVRPEHVRPAANGVLRGRVALNEDFGAARCLHVDTSVGRVIARVAADDRTRTGDPVALDVAPECAHVFDARTEMRLA